MEGISYHTNNLARRRLAVAAIDHHLLTYRITIRKMFSSKRFIDDNY
jgi:hypothetical protein